MANRKITESEYALIMREKNKLPNLLDSLIVLTRAYAYDTPVEEKSLNKLLSKLNTQKNDR